MKKRELVEKIKGLKSRGKALILAGLVLLGSSAYVKTVNAENKDMIPTDYFSEFTFERLPIETIFDMTIEGGQRKIIPGETYLVLLEDKVLDREMFIPTTMEELLIIKDDKKNTKNNKALLEDGKGILLSELKKLIPNIIFKNLNINGGDPNKIYVYYEIYSHEIVAFSNNKLSARIIDFDYLAKYAIYDGERDKVSGSYAVIPYLLTNFIDNNVEDKFLNREDVPYKLLDKEITLEKYLTDVYMKIVPYNYWPVNISFSKEDVFIPQFSEEKRNQSIVSNNVGVGFVLNIDDTLVKIIIYKYNADSKEYVDFYTCQKMELERVEAWLKINNEPYQLEEAYDIVSGYDNQVASHNQLFLPFRNSPHPIKLFEQYGHKYGLRSYYDFMKRINENTTIGELTDYYNELLPLEYVIDYTGFDFSNNPDIINAEKSKEPQLVKTPGN